jgi:hypothetical protein
MKDKWLIVVVEVQVLLLDVEEEAIVVDEAEAARHLLHHRHHAEVIQSVDRVHVHVLVLVHDQTRANDEHDHQMIEMVELKRRMIEAEEVGEVEVGVEVEAHQMNEKINDEMARMIDREHRPLYHLHLHPLLHHQPTTVRVALATQIVATLQATVVVAVAAQQPHQ